MIEYQGFNGGMRVTVRTTFISSKSVPPATSAHNPLFGGEGDDTLEGGIGNYTLSGGSGNDLLNASFGNDIARGDAGNDSLNGGSGEDGLSGGADDDVLNGGFGIDTLNGEAGNDVLGGDYGVDLLYGGEGNDTLIGGYGDDSLNGGIGQDVLDGGAHNDTLYGGADRDTLSGGIGKDRLDGGIDADSLAGGFGSDTLLGGAGADSLVGGTDNDWLAGGAGEDTAVFTGNAADYVFFVTDEGIICVAEDSTVGSNGTDKLVGIEMVQFLDRTYRIAPEGQGGDTYLGDVKSYAGGKEPGESSVIAPVAIGLGDGGYMIAYSQPAYQGVPDITGTHFDLNGEETYGGDWFNYGFTINATTAHAQINPGAVAMADGGFIVTWQSFAQDSDTSGMYGDWGIYGQRYSAAGTTMGGEFLINSTTSGNQIMPALAATSDGRFVAVWQSDQNGSSTIFARRFDPLGTAVGWEFPVDDLNTASKQSHAQVAVLADDGFMIVWQALGQSGGNDIYARRYDAWGAPVGTASRVNSTVSGAQTDPSLTRLTDGSVVVAWQSVVHHGASDGVKTIYAQRLSAGGELLGDEFPVSRHPGENQTDPVVTALTSGEFVVTWQTQHQEGDWDIEGQLFSADGTALGLPLNINTYTAGDQTHPSVAALQDGGFVVAWDSYGQSYATGYAVYSQRFDSEGRALGGLQLTGSSAGDKINLKVDGYPYNGINVQGLAGNDTIISGIGSDTLDGGDGIDTLSYTMNRGSGVRVSLDAAVTPSAQTIENAAGDVLGNFENLLGSANSDYLSGNVLANVLDGGLGYDTLLGGSGDDTLRGGGDDDTLYGNLGADVFDFNEITQYADRIKDFSHTDGDVIDLHNLDAKISQLGNQDFVFIGNSDFTAAGQVRYEYSDYDSVGSLMGNIDADKSSELYISISGVKFLTVADLVL